MHHSRFAGLIIDCHTDDLDGAADFWSAALGYPKKAPADEKNCPYVELVTPDSDPYFAVQKVDHSSRVHLDIEADDLEAEAARLESLGARRIGKIKTWIVMEAPTGQRFCVVVPVSKHFPKYANQWGRNETR